MNDGTTSPDIFADRAMAQSSSDGAPNLSLALVQLMKGVVYRDTHEAAWSSVVRRQPQIRDHVDLVGLMLVVDDAEGFAYLRSVPDPEPGGDDTDDDTQPVPRLIPRRSLSFPVSLLLALLRKKLAEFDAEGNGARLILTRDQIVDTMRVFLPERHTETRLVDQIDAHITRAVDLGFLRRVKDGSGSAGSVEVRRILKAFVDAQWLADFDQRLSEYRVRITGPNGSEGEA